MSEPHETPEAEVVDDEAEPLEGEEELEGSEDDEDAEGEKSAKPVADWERKFHDKEGQAARERSRRRAAERQVSELNERLEKVEKQTRSMTPSKRAALIARLRSDSEEPLADLDDLKEIARTLLEEDLASQQENEQQQAQDRYINTLTGSMKEFEADFRLDHKDYDKACEHFKQTRIEELEEMGYSGQRLTQRLAQELYGMVDDAVRAGRDPAEAAYNMAKRRGFAATADDATRKLQKLQNGARSGVSASPGSSGAGRVTYAQVTQAKGAQRDKLWTQLRKQEMGAKGR